MTREGAYAILNLTTGATVEQIKNAHYRLMMSFIPTMAVRGPFAWSGIFLLGGDD
jgi:DnaJ-class molecular chaperone